MESRHRRKQKPVRSKARQGFTAVAATDRGNSPTGSGNGGDKHACDVQLHAVRRQPGGPRKAHGVSQFAVNSRASRDHPDEPVQGCVRTEDDQEQDHHGRPDRLRPENQEDLLYMKSRRRPTAAPEKQDHSDGSDLIGQEPTTFLPTTAGKPNIRRPLPVSERGHLHGVLKKCRCSQ
jgi:hypothetical protein